VWPAKMDTQLPPRRERLSSRAERRRLGLVSTRRARTVEVFSEAAATYNTVGPAFFSEFARKLVEFADVAGDEDILDVATGTGVVLFEAAGHVRSATRLVGVDLTQAMLSRAAAEVERRGLPGIDLQLMDAESLSFADFSFDLVFCAFAFSSFPDKPQAIREFVRVLRPGGRVCILDSPDWYFDHDARWSWHGELLEAFAGPRAESEVPPRQPRELPDLLVANDLRNVVVAEEAHELTFQDAEEWWRWSWSDGTRLLLDAIPESNRVDFRDAAFAELSKLQSREGMIAATICATLARADRPR
jgi:SAM-dependent methyltransferase